MTLPANILGGAYNARRCVVDFLDKELPVLYQRLGRVWGLDSVSDWQPPKKIYDHEVIRLEPKEFPVMVVSVISTNSMTPIGPDDVTGDPLYIVDYNMRVYSWMRSDTAESVSKLRDYQTTSVRLALINTPSLRPKPDRSINSQYDIKVRPESFNEDYSEITGHGQNFYIAGSYVNFGMTLLERGGIDVLSDLDSPPADGWGIDVNTKGTRGSAREQFDLDPGYVDLTGNL